MGLLASMGHRFVVSTLGAPKALLLNHDLTSHGVLAFEVNCNSDGLERQKTALTKIRQDSNVLVYFSKIRSGESSRFDGKHFTHFVKAGFTVQELLENQSSIQGYVRSGAIDGVSVRIDADNFIINDLLYLSQFADETDIRILVSLKAEWRKCRAGTDKRCSNCGNAGAGNGCI